MRRLNSKLSQLLRLDELEPVYHGQTGVRTLRELARSYLTTTKDLTRVGGGKGESNERRAEGRSAR